MHDVTAYPQVISRNIDTLHLGRLYRCQIFVSRLGTVHYFCKSIQNSQPTFIRHPRLAGWTGLLSLIVTESSNFLYSFIISLNRDSCKQVLSEIRTHSVGGVCIAKDPRTGCLVGGIRSNAFETPLQARTLLIRVPPQRVHFLQNADHDCRPDECPSQGQQEIEWEECCACTNRASEACQAGGRLTKTKERGN